MGKQKSRSSRVSNGGRQKANVSHEEARQARFARRREAGKIYQWKPNPYKKGSEEWLEEEHKREENRKSSKLKIAQLDSIFAKLKNDLAKKALEDKEKKARKNNK